MLTFLPRYRRKDSDTTPAKQTCRTCNGSDMQQRHLKSTLFILASTQKKTSAWRQEVRTHNKWITETKKFGFRDHHATNEERQCQSSTSCSNYHKTGMHKSWRHTPYFWAHLCTGWAPNALWGETEKALWVSCTEFTLFLYKVNRIQYVSTRNKHMRLHFSIQHFVTCGASRFISPFTLHGGHADMLNS